MSKNILLFLVGFFSLAVVVLSYEETIHRHWSPLLSLDSLNSGNQIHRPHKDTPITIQLALKQQNLDLLEKTFWEVSNPKSTNYGKYLSKLQIAEIVAPNESEIKKVVLWLAQNNAFDIDLMTTRDVIEAKMTVENIEKMLNVQMAFFENINTGRMLIRSLENARDFMIPDEIKSIVEIFHGVADFPMPTRKDGTRRVEKQKKRNRHVDSRDFTAGVPIIYDVNARDGDPQISITFIPICLNGQNSSTIPPCTDYPPVVGDTSNILAYPVLDVMPQMNYSATLVNNGMCYIDNDTTFCTITVQVPYYEKFGVDLTVSFVEQNETSFTVSAPWPVIVTPPVFPNTIASLYNIPPNQRVVSMTATQSVAEFEEQYYTPDDLAFFFQSTGLPDNTNVTVIGPNDPSIPGVEANLDIQYIMGVGVGAPTVFWSIPQNTTFQADDILEWAYQVGNDSNPPIVHSLSYGMPEDQVDAYFGAGYLDRSDVEFQKLALQGLTIIIACGDTGAGDMGEAPGESSCQVLHPDWPSQSPYVTALGTTFITPYSLPVCYLPKDSGGINCEGLPLGEASVSLDAGFLWTTGGGFSNTRSRPSYQDGAVNVYLNQHSSSLPPSNMFNSSGRAYPDFVTVGHNVMVAQGGEFFGVDGTSCSAPIFGGIVTLLNDVRIRNGLPQLGFLNPLFYDIAANYPEAFRDVTVGDNRCAEDDSSPTCCTAAYQATSGWDAVSGNGSPNFGILADLVLNYNSRN